MDYLLHIANVLYLFAYSVRNVMWLRIITVIAILCLIPYYYAHQMPMPIAWNALFVAVNIVQIVLLVLENRPVFLGEEELQLYRTVFRGLKPREFLKLLSIAQWKQAKLGEEILAQDKPVAELILISSGRGTVELDRRYVADLGGGQFVGEMGFLTEKPASASVVASLPTTYLSWPVAKLRTLLATTPGLHLKIQGVLGSDLVGKLRHNAIANAHPSLMAAALRDAGAQ